MTRLDQLKSFVDKDPNDSFSRYGLAMEFLSNGQYAESLAQFAALKSQDGNYLPLYYQLGKLYELLEDRDSAKKVYEEGMALAGQQNNFHTKSELQAALEEME